MQKEKTQIDALGKLRNEVESAFVEYRSNLSSKRPLGKLASRFAIPIDTGRLEDYYVRSLDIESLSISVVDISTDTVYRSRYTYHTKLLPVLLSAGLYLEAFSNKGAVQTQKLYRVTDGEKNLLKLLSSELIITYGDRALTFEKYQSDDEYDKTSIQRPFKMSLEVSQPTYDDISKRQPLYSRTFTSPLCKTRVGLREETTISPTIKSTWQMMKDFKTGALHYFIDRENEKSHIYGYVRDIDKNASTAEQSQKHLIHLIEIKPKTGLCTNVLDVYKKNDVLKINCQIDAIPFYVELYDVTKGSLTPIEVGHVIEVLQASFYDREFMRAVLLELQEFGYRLSLHKGFASAPNYILAPERFVNLSFAKIEEVIMIDIDAYFAEAEEEYKNIRGRLSGQTPAFSHQMKPVE